MSYQKTVLFKLYNDEIWGLAGFVKDFTNNNLNSALFKTKALKLHNY